jgi:hypothetical protein
MLERMRATPGLVDVPVVLLTSSRSPDVITKAAKFGV